EEVDYEYVDLDTLLRESDFVVLTVDLNPETYHLIDYEKLSKMKRTAFLINASRGAVVKEDDLVRALKEGLIAGAALDVFEREPIGKDHPLAQLPNVVLTPHIGSATRETRERMAEVAVRNLILALEGRKPLYEVP
ncbi:MAG: D-glycerate dehydrogenase, partial [Sulfolobales archaeon]|nr:D-glycerate dehydrogenase [Sulfolobales archaeon]MCQ4343683.1 D-glycerate dehydrogenase [Sulfolobales archaeon]